MSSLSAREQRILTEIERNLATAEPRLELALTAARVPMFQYWPVVRSGHPKFRRNLWTAAMLASLLCGIGLLTIGIAGTLYPLIFAGIPLTQLGPFVATWRATKRRQAARQMSR